MGEYQYYCNVQGKYKVDMKFYIVYFVYYSEYYLEFCKQKNCDCYLYLGEEVVKYFYLKY